MLVRQPRKERFLSVYMDDIKLQNINPTKKMLVKEVDLQVYWGCTQRACLISKDIVDSYKRMFESWISTGAMERYQKLKLQVKLRHTLHLHGPMTWKVTKKCVDRF